MHFIFGCQFKRGKIELLLASEKQVKNIGIS
jgi:hypothetical protein